MKGNGKKIFAAILVVFFVGYLLVTGIGDLINKKDIQSIRIDECVEILTIEHSINGLIPVGKDHYYIGIDDELNVAAFIKASKGWYGRNFDSEGRALKKSGLNLTCLAKKPRDFDVEKELAARAEELEGIEMITPQGYSLEINYKIDAISKLVLLGAAVILVIGGIKISKSDGGIKGATGKIYLVVCIVFLVLLLKVLI